MKKARICSSRTHALFLLLICFVTRLDAQQPSANRPAQPTATPGQTQQPSAPQPAQPVPQEGQPEGQQIQGPPPGFDRVLLTDPNAKPRAMTVDEAISLALRQANAYAQAQFDERVAAEDLKQSRAAFLPRFTMPFTYFGTTPSQVHEEGEPLIYSYVSSSAINETIALFNAAGEIDLAGRLHAAVSRNRNLLAAARAGSLVARRTLALDTVDAYYALVLARQKRRLAEETLSLAEGFLKVTEGFVQRGEDESEGADLLRARAIVASRRDELEQARAGELAAMNTLRVQTGVDFATPIDVTRIAQNLPTAADFLNFTEDQIRQRPELSQLDFQKRAALDDARAAKGDRLPQLTYSLNGGFDAADFRPLKRYAGGSAIVTLTIPIFDFGASKSRETQARLRAQSLDAQRELMLRQIRQEFYTARGQALTALTRIKETDAGVAAAQRNLTLVFAHYRAKKATITDVVDAQSAFADARLAYFQAIVDYHTAHFRLEQSLGK
ncbi:MAG TPA: TolC family protein [Pyrinomonadaceae bacterium]